MVVWSGRSLRLATVFVFVVWVFLYVGYVFLIVLKKNLQKWFDWRPSGTAFVVLVQMNVRLIFVCTGFQEVFPVIKQSIFSNHA
jgi:hypothetical protein